MLLIGPPILRECHTQQPLQISTKTPSKPSKNHPLKLPQNPCSQLFFAINPATSPDSLINLLEKSWSHDSLTTLRLICYLRSLGVGQKGYNEWFYIAAHWLHKHHPLTLACSVRELAIFGSLRDFPEILLRLVNEENSGLRCRVKGSVSRKELEMENARRAVCNYVQDPSYRFLHERVSDVFADLLRSDLESLKYGNVQMLSNASVDCPSVGSSCDRQTLLCESIAKKVFPKESDPSYSEIKDDHYVYRVRNRLRKEVLGPLRMALQGKAQAERGSVQVRDQTLDHMKKAYQKILTIKNKTKKEYYQTILAMRLKGRYFPATPLSVVASLNESNSEAKDLEWKAMVQDFSEKGKLRNSVAVCDVSGDMNETTKNLSISMGLLISELSNHPWKGTLYGFNKLPKLCSIEGDDLRSKINSVRQLECTGRVDIEAILNQILQVAVDRPEKMVKRVFVFTNKDFRTGSNHCWGWNFKSVWENYRNSGFFSVPEVVFWNIEGSNSRPPTVMNACENRFLTINGFSRNLFAFFLDKDAVWRSDDIKSISTAEDVMQVTLSGKEYQNLAVLD